VTPVRIAIVGLACRVPGAANATEFWSLLHEGREGIRRFTDRELADAGVSASIRHRSDYVPATGALNGIEWFDAPFFGIPPREVEILDPQHRIFLEMAWEALEDAGCDPERCRGRIGVYAGTGMSTYLLNNLLPADALQRVTSPLQVLMANNKDYVPTRASYRLNLRGPSLSINTACSTSLVAVHVACQALIAQECDVALAGGLGIQVPQDRGYVYEPEGILSPDGHCRAFSRGAAGTVSGNGGGLVVLKRLEDAEADGDAIRAIVLGTAVNNDGAAKVGYTAPSVAGQTDVIAEAIAVADVPLDTIDYIEAHGTGTAVGDPIEIQALAQVFADVDPSKHRCAIGSVKSNVGHLDEGAGVAGLIKTVLALQHGEIPPTLHVDAPNPACGFERTPFVVNTERRAWTRRRAPRRAGVSSFGIGGTNAHVVLEEAVARATAPSSRAASILTVSARSADALSRAVSALARRLADDADVPIADVAHTLQLGRRAFPWRRAVVCRDVADGLRRLATAADPVRASAPPIVFVFPGQGSQYAGMAQALYSREPHFRTEFDRVAAATTVAGGPDLSTLISQGPEFGDRINETVFAQPALFAVEYALARLWMHWGIEPAAMIGHSLGEYVAACLAGMLSLEDAVRLVVRRANAMAAAPRGAMAAVALDEASARCDIAQIGAEVCISAVNSAGQCVVAGTESELARFADALDAREIDVRRLKTSHAFHSPLMDAAARVLAEHAKEMATPRVPLVSNVHGDWIGEGDCLDRGYWSRHLTSAVRFADGIATIVRRHSDAVFVEVGPGRHLAPHVRQLTSRPIVASLPHPREQADDHDVLLTALGKLWEHGAPVAWERFAEPGRRRVSLPTYPFERSRHWIDAPTSVEAPVERPSVIADESPIESWLFEPRWQPTPLSAGGPRTADTIVLIAPDQDAPSWLPLLADRLARAADRFVTVSPPSATDYERLPEANAVPADARVTIVSARLGDGVGTLFNLAHALGRDPRLHAIVALTEGGAAVTSSDPVRPDVAAVAGLSRALQAEHGDVVVRHIDLRAPLDPLIVGALTADVLAGDDGDPSIAYRGDERYIPSIAPVHVGTDRPVSPPIRDGGVYLITGGLGSMGLAFAEWIASRARATIVLAARTLPSDTAPHARIADVAASIEVSQGVDSAARRAMLDRLCGRIILETFTTGGVDLYDGARTTVADARARLLVTPAYARMFEWCLDVLSDDRLIARDGDTIVGQWDGMGESAASLAAVLKTAHHDLAGLADLLTHCAAQYADVFAGRIEGTEVLYPDGTTNLLDRFSSTIGDYSFDRVCREAAAAYIAQLASRVANRPLRILEVGGGTGTFTEAIVRHLAGTTSVELTFTDVSTMFVTRAEAQARARGLEGVRFRRLDISRPLDEQGLPLAHFDLVTGYNVVHATRDVRASLRHLRAALAPDGTICLVETTRTARWDQLVWGLTTGWWAFDDGLRHSSPILDLDAWQGAVRDAGFENVDAWAGDAADSADVDAGVIVAHVSAADTVTPRVQAIEARGSRVAVVRADVTDAAAVTRLVADVEATHGRVCGVIHTAGVIGRGLAADKSIADAQRVMAPKLAGAVNLAAALRDRAPDFFVVCSSLASRYPVPGQADYAAANAALDGFAHEYTRTTGAFAVSIGWGFWQELGMIAKSAMPVAQQEQIVRTIHDKGWTARGVDALASILTQRYGPEVLVSPQAPSSATSRRHPALGERQDREGYTSYRVQWNEQTQWIVDEHHVDGARVLPGTGVLELARAAYADRHGDRTMEIRNAYFVEPFFADGAAELCLVLQDRDGCDDFTLVSRTGREDRWQLHARGEIRPLDASERRTIDVPALADGIPAALAERMSGFGPRWSNVEAVAIEGSVGLARLRLPSPFASECRTFALHPAIFDNATGFLPIHRQTDARVPFAYASIALFAPLSREIICRAEATGEAGARDESFDVTMADTTGRVLAIAKGYTLRLLPPATAVRTVADNAELRIEMRGSLDTIAFAAAPRSRIGADEVEIQVETTGINFIEVLYALGMLPEAPGGAFTFGLECAGTVTQVGSAVTGIVTGQRVAAFANASGRVHAVVPASTVAVLPDHLSWDDAATIPAAYMTAYTALVEQARLRRGETALVHSAAGGVGLAAIHVARAFGARVLATAGSDEKRVYLRSIGVDLVMDSHSTAFAAETMAATGGRGVDVVLNSLSGDYIDLGLSVLAPGGRFVELGKRDILDGRAVSLAPFRRRLSFIAVDVGPDLPEFARVWRDVWAHVESGTFPPLPRRVFDARQAAAAFAEMARGRHIGKFVLSFDDRETILRDAVRGARREGQPLGEILGLAAPVAPERASTTDEFERAIAAIWEDLLGTQPIGREDDFFSLNGDSLLGAQVIARLQRQFGVKCPLSAIFDRPTVASLAALVRERVEAVQAPELEEGVI
jgi:acyl transferase domain-containing protein/NADPH:quinone reductase-like Zn-dependent oxidoreductase/SAM-dependent methyltransferase